MLLVYVEPSGVLKCPQCTVDVLVMVWDLFPLNLWANGD